MSPYPSRIMTDENQNCFALQHEIFILDAHLEESLDASRYKEITNSLQISTLSMVRSKNKSQQVTHLKDE